MLSMNYIKDEENYYKQKIKELTEKDEYNIRRSQRQQKEIDRLMNELSIKTTYIEDLLKLILKSKDFELQKEIYEHGIEYDKKLKELKEGKQ